MDEQKTTEDKIFTERLYFVVALVILLLALVFSVIYFVSKNRREVNALQNQISELKNKVYTLTELNNSLLANPKIRSNQSSVATSSPVIPTEQRIACVAFAYSDWSSCSVSGEQTRSVIDSLPAGCVDGGPFLTRKCLPPAKNVSQATETPKTAPPASASEAPTLTPRVDVKINGQDGTVVLGSPQNITVSWTSENVSSCQIVGDGASGSGSGVSSSGSISYYADSTLNITMSCTGSSGDASDSAGVYLSQ